MVKRIFIIGLIVFLAGCAGLKTQNYSPPVWAELNDEYLDTFIGKDISEAQKIFGYKYTTSPLDDHSKAYNWEMNNQVGFGLSWIGSTKTIPCNWSLITDPNGRIIDKQRFGYCNATLKIR